MPEKELNANLARLHDELSKADEVDESTAELLGVVIGDIRQLLERSEKTRQDVDPVQHRLQDLVAKSEAEHPQLVGLLRKLADGLANLGI